MRPAGRAVAKPCAAIAMRRAAAAEILVGNSNRDALNHDIRQWFV